MLLKLIFRNNTWNGKEVKDAVDLCIIKDDTRVTQFLLYSKLAFAAFYDCMYTVKHNKQLMSLLYYILADLRFMELDEDLYRNVNEITEQYISFYYYYYLLYFLNYEFKLFLFN